MARPDFVSENKYFDGFHCCEYASTEVATPISPNPAARASDAIKRNGTPVVITRLSFEYGMTSVIVCAYAEDINPIPMSESNIFFMIKKQ